MRRAREPTNDTILTALYPLSISILYLQTTAFQKSRTVHPYYPILLEHSHLVQISIPLLAHQQQAHSKMQSSSPDNANPTILNVTQLPSRERRVSGVAGGPESKYDSLLASRPTASFWGFSGALSSDECSDYEAEPIDEQEIYGQCVVPHHHHRQPLPLTLHTLAPGVSNLGPAHCYHKCYILFFYSAIHAESVGSRSVSKLG